MDPNDGQVPSGLDPAVDLLEIPEFPGGPHDSSLNTHAQGLPTNNFTSHSQSVEFRNDSNPNDGSATTSNLDAIRSHRNAGDARLRSALSSAVNKGRAALVHFGTPISPPFASPSPGIPAGCTSAVGATLGTLSALLPKSGLTIPVSVAVFSLRPSPFSFSVFSASFACFLAFAIAGLGRITRVAFGA